MTEQRDHLLASDLEWVATSSQLAPRPDRKINEQSEIGVVNGLAVYGPNMGTLLDIEATAVPVQKGKGVYTITGVVDEEEIGGGNRTLRRKSMAKGSVENVLTVLKSIGLHPANYDLHINFPGGTPIDGPSAGMAIATAIASAIKRVPVDNRIAMTGELGIHGKVKPVGGVVAKVEAAFQAGATTVLIPKDNWQTLFEGLQGLRVIPVESISEVFRHVFGAEAEKNFDLSLSGDSFVPAPAPFLHAESPRGGTL
ncbi:Lon protease 2 [compost metagenome]